MARHGNRANAGHCVCPEEGHTVSPQHLLVTLLLSDDVISPPPRLSVGVGLVMSLVARQMSPMRGRSEVVSYHQADWGPSAWALALSVPWAADLTS